MNSGRMSRIRSAVQKAGMTDLPESDDVSLADYGLDSLMMALILSECEREFKIKVRPEKFRREAFETLGTLEKFLVEMGLS
jgi:acyl carrier protein